MMKKNYQLEMEKEFARIAEQGIHPRLLLHSCCAPCSSAVLERLCRYFDITVLYYNPNTWPAEEYHRRGEELERFVAAAHPLGVTVVEDRYDPQEFYSAVAGLENEPERGSRCTVCYRLRMRRAAQYAAEHGFDWFTTTLSISPHKDAKRINAIGQELERNARILGTKGSIFLPDFQHAETMTLEVEGKEPEVIRCPVDINGFEYEIREASRCVKLGRTGSDRYTPQDSLALTRLMYDTRMSWGMKFAGEV